MFPTQRARSSNKQLVNDNNTALSLVFFRRSASGRFYQVGGKKGAVFRPPDCVAMPTTHLYLSSQITPRRATYVTKSFAGHANNQKLVDHGKECERTRISLPSRDFRSSQTNRSAPMILRHGERNRPVPFGRRMPASGAGCGPKRRAVRSSCQEELEHSACFNW